MFKQINYPAQLPIVANKDLIIDKIRRHQVVVIAGDTGSGKSTQLAKMCLEAGRGAKQRIGCTQPRRIAATSVATRVSEEMGEDGAALVGYKVRFQDHTKKTTRIKFMTDGILLAETRRDPMLRSYDTIIVDEAHERSLNIDFLLGILSKLLAKRADLKLIITSATIDTDKFSKAFRNAPIIKVSGRTYPVDIIYRPLDDAGDGGSNENYIEQTVQAAHELRQIDCHGDMLIFMPAERDIRETVDLLNKSLANLKDRGGRDIGSAYTVLPLFGRLSGADQNRIFKPARGQKIVVATNVAETSLTVPGIKYVIDTGLARIATYNVRARTSKLPISPISRASADQRAGRCGRVAPGICMRLYGEDDYLNRPEFTLPEIQRSNLAEVILRMIFLKLGNPDNFPFIDPPSGRAIRDGYKLLEEVDAIAVTKGDYRTARLTAHGRLMAHLPLDPRISRMIIEARDLNCLKEMVIIAAALSIADPRVRPADKEKEADAKHEKFKDEHSDFLAFIKIWRAVEKLPSQGKLRKFCRLNYISYQKIREWRDIHEQIMTIIKAEKGFRLNQEDATYESIHRAILSGNLRNIALKKKKNIYQGGRGSELMVFPGSALFGKAGQWIMAAEIVETARLFGRCVADINVDWIEPLAGSLCRSNYSAPHWEKKRGQVVALEKVSLFGLPIVSGRKVDFGRIDPAEAREIFIQTALVEGELAGNLPFLDHNLALVKRVQDMEDRVRQRDIIVDDNVLFEYYDSRLDVDIRDRHSLHRFVKGRNKKFLYLNEADILNKPPSEDELEKYPENIMAGELCFDLAYKFEPGTEDDGVSVMLAVDLVDEVKSDYFEWLVPGLIEEKILYLLKGLPKSLRKRLIPIPSTAKELTEAVSGRGGSLYMALQEEIQRRFQVRITRKDWPKEEQLPRHLQVRYCLVDKGKRVIKESRNLKELKHDGALRAAVVAGGGLSLDSVRRKWQRHDIKDWDFAGLPARIGVADKNEKVSGFAYPALVLNKQGSCDLELFSAEKEAAAHNRLGLIHIYKKYFSQFKKLKKDFTLASNNWALYEGIGSHKEINDAIYEFILVEIFQTRDGKIPDRPRFEAIVKEVQKNGIFKLGTDILAQIVDLLRERRAVLDMLSRLEAAAAQKNNQFIAFFRKETQRLVPTDFLQIISCDQLPHLVRYLKALQIRIERANIAPQKDSQKAKELVVHEKRLAQAQKNTHLAEGGDVILQEFRQMIEELRVSLFAQEIKTAFPISAKRLDKKWQELEMFLYD